MSPLARNEVGRVPSSDESTSSVPTVYGGDRVAPFSMAGTKRSREDDGNDGERDPANCIAKRATLRQEADAPPRKKRIHTTSKRRSASPTRRGFSPSSPFLAPPTGTDYLTPLSDELLIRILGYLSLTSLLALAPVSRRFHRLADDSQLWKAIYYERFVLPRALRIPGFRGGSLTNSRRTTTGAVGDTAVHVGYPAELEGASAVRRPSTLSAATAPGQEVFTEPRLSSRDRQADGTRASGKATTSRNDLWKPRSRGRIPNWKQQYRLRHNWARGKCAVEELRLGSSRGGSSGFDEPMYHSQDEDDDGSDQFSRILVKVVDGIAVTADRRRGLRVWELKSRSMVAGGSFAGRRPQARTKRKATEDADVDEHGETGEGGAHDGAESSDEHDAPPVPTSLAVDVTANGLDIAIGLLDGGFDVWQLDLMRKTLVRRFSHEASSSGPLTGIAYSHPYVLTATDSVLISLYAFGTGGKPAQRLGGAAKSSGAAPLSAPHLLTSLRSHTSRPPLALSIRKLASVTVASIAYTFSTRQGWSIGIQDLHVKAPGHGESKGVGADGLGLPTVVTTRLAYTLPVSSGGQSSSMYAQRPAPDAALSSPIRARTSPSSASASASTSASPLSSPPAMARAQRRQQRQHGDEDEDERIGGGPTTLCYTHPYLLATMPDNTLILHLCTSNASTLAISAGIRLWGHTSGISDAEITARGKAVSVSMRGEEMRVWELEGRPAAERGRSVAIRPNAGDAEATGSDGSHDDAAAYDWDERRNWVGFDDEMVIVLKESRGGRESLMVYDFT